MVSDWWSGRGRWFGWGGGDSEVVFAPHLLLFHPNRSWFTPNVSARVSHALPSRSRLPPPGGMRERRRYPSDLSDARWALVEPLLTSWRVDKARHGLNIGTPPQHDLRNLLDAILYVARTGIPWRYLPHDSRHWNSHAEAPDPRGRGPQRGADGLRDRRPEREDLDERSRP